MKARMADLLRDLSRIHPLVFSICALSCVGMNLLANKSIDTGISWLALDAGILFSGAAFLGMDVATHCYGPRTATTMSLTILVLNLLMVGFFFVGSHIPGVWGESFVDGSEQVINQALDNTFGGTWFVILGSSIAYAVSAVVNNFLNWSIGKHVGSTEDEGVGSFGTFALRSYVSTFSAQFVDNLTFALLVSHHFFGWSLLQCVTCALTGAVVELLFEMLFSPFGYRISRSILLENGHGLALKA
jgi:uncharacterized PurR-regulated membrane protein YhhQ (DUF165 family)